jgi:hypothetical protein
MAKRRIVNQTLDKFIELSMLTFNMRYYQKEFKKFGHPEDEDKKREFEERVDAWMNNNTEIEE